MLTVWKYPIPIKDRFTLFMPAIMEPLSVQMQDGQPVFWALVNPAYTFINFSFRLVGTGHSLEDITSFTYIGTFQLTGLVFHLFRVS